MSYLYILSWFALIVQAVAATFSVGAGLFYLAEIIEEYATIAKKLINFTIGAIAILAIGLLVFDGLPLKLPLLTLISNVLYFASLRTFPFIEVYSPVFLSSIVAFVVHHYVAFSYFAEHYHEFYEVLTYFTLFCWIVPVLLLMSLSANDNVLPVYGNSQQQKQDTGTADNDLVTNYFKRKSNKRYGLLPTLRYFQENYLPSTRRDRKSY